MVHILAAIREHAPALERLQAIPGVTVRTAPPVTESRPFSADELNHVDIYVGQYLPTNFHDLRKVKLIQLASVGYAQIYGHGLAERGIRVCNARGAFDTAIAEWNVAMMINLGRNLRQMIRNQEHSRWDKGTDGRFAWEIRGQVVGLWGYGGIGRETARLAKALGMRVHVLTRSPIGPRTDCFLETGTGDPEGRLPDQCFSADQVSEFLPGIDYLILAMPLTPRNQGILGDTELRSLRPTAFLLNPARGALVKEDSLLRALREGWIAGAALDTHYYYPMPPEHPLWALPQVIMTPHISGSDRGPHFVERMWTIVLHNVQQFLTGGSLWNELTAAEIRGQT